MAILQHSELDLPHVRYDWSNRLGERVAENYKKSKNKTPGGACTNVCHRRLQWATRQLCGKALPDLTHPIFGRLWSSMIEPKDTWLLLPEFYRGKGAAGAMAWAGLGTLVESVDIWAGNLKPGAVLQTWRIASDFSRVRDGNKARSWGHSLIFLKYTHARGAITGMKIADQGFQSLGTLKKGDYAYWIGANVLCSE